VGRQRNVEVVVVADKIDGVESEQDIVRNQDNFEALQAKAIKNKVFGGGICLIGRGETVRLVDCELGRHRITCWSRRGHGMDSAAGPAP
jgi:hypothetical protein